MFLVCCDSALLLLVAFRFLLYTLCLKKIPTFKLSVTLSNLNRFANFLHSNLLQNPHDTTHLTLCMLLHYLGKLKIQIVCGYSADVEENPNKLHFKSTDFNSSTRVTVYTECIYVLTEYLKYLGIRRHSDFLRQNVDGSEKSWLLCGSIWWLCNFFGRLLTPHFD